MTFSSEEFLKEIFTILNDKIRESVSTLGSPTLEILGLVDNEKWVGAGGHGKDRTESFSQLWADKGLRREMFQSCNTCYLTPSGFVSV